MAEYGIFKEMGLSFEESIYAIAFDLESEIREKGKEAVFSELPWREEMCRRVQDVFERWRDDYETCALKNILGGQPIPDDVIYDNEDSDDESACCRIFHGTIEQNFHNAIGTLRKRGWIRYWLAGGEKLQRHYREMMTRSTCQGMASLQPSDSYNSKFYDELHQLTTKLRLLDAKRAEILTKIKELTGKIESQGNYTVNLAATNNVKSKLSSSEPVDSEGSISQLEWSARSEHILSELQITTVAEAVAYFNDFDHFVKSKKITYWEWNAIVLTLWRHKLLPSREVMKYDDNLDVFLSYGYEVSMPVRTYNCLRRAGLDDEVQALFELFANGVMWARGKLFNTRNFGKGTEKFLFKKMASNVIVIPSDLCVPDERSGVVALDLANDEKDDLKYYQINTIGELIAACSDQNRFSGLRYINPELYKCMLTKLEKYGFSLQKEATVNRLVPATEVSPSEIDDEYDADAEELADLFVLPINVAELDVMTLDLPAAWLDDDSKLYAFSKLLHVVRVRIAELGGVSTVSFGKIHIKADGLLARHLGKIGKIQSGSKEFDFDLNDAENWDELRETLLFQAGECKFLSDELADTINVDRVLRQSRTLYNRYLAGALEHFFKNVLTVDYQLGETELSVNHQVISLEQCPQSFARRLALEGMSIVKAAGPALDFMRALSSIYNALRLAEVDACVCTEKEVSLDHHYYWEQYPDVEKIRVDWSNIPALLNAFVKYAVIF